MKYSKEVSIQTYEGYPIAFSFAEERRFINLTQMAKPFKKKPNDFLRQENTKRFIGALATRCGDSRNGIVKVVQGGNDKDMQGTWGHELLALKFAGWLSPAFEVWMMERIREMLTNVSADKENTSLALMNTRESGEQTECRQLIEKLMPVYGSAARLSVRLGVSDTTVSCALNGRWKYVKTPILARMLAVLRHLDQHGTGYDPRIIELLMRIDDTEVRTQLFHQFKNNAIL